MNPYCPKCKKMMQVTKSGYYKCPQCKEKYKRGQDIILPKGIVKSEEQVKEELKSMMYEEARKGRGRPEFQGLPLEMRQRLELQRMEQQKPIARRIRRRLTKKFGKRKHDKKEETTK